jgi:hypothetical protein
MSDILNIRVTERELDLIMDLLHEAGERPDADGNPAVEICHDLMEQSGRWAEIEPTEIAEGSSFTVAEDDFIDAGIQAREQVKASSMAATRRAQRFGEFEVKPEGREPSEVQRHDLWERPNDSTKW